jgi:mannose/fructose-specific phosphotransferase system component IIA
VTGEPVRGILVTHGRLGAELRQTAESILGPQEELVVVSNAGLSIEGLADQLRTLVPRGQPSVLFVDLPGGSCGHICVLLASGVNLPMLLEFLVHRSRVSPAELKRRLLTRACEAIRCLGWEAEGDR